MVNTNGRAVDAKYRETARKVAPAPSRAIRQVTLE
jgi:hypothetical protein